MGNFGLPNDEKKFLGTVLKYFKGNVVNPH
jgi:hypothetical protein